MNLVFEAENLHDVTLIGGSSAGAVITAVADRSRERAARLIYVDAFLPANGQSTIDLLPPDQAEALRRLVQSEGDGWLLRCVKSSPSPFDRAASAAQASPGWTYRALQTYHVPFIPNPDEVAQAILEIIA